MKGKLSHLIEKKGATARLLEETFFVPARVGERPFLVSEQLRLHKVLGDSAAIDRDKGFAASW